MEKGCNGRKGDRSKGNLTQLRGRLGQKEVANRQKGRDEGHYRDLHKPEEALALED